VGVWDAQLAGLVRASVLSPNSILSMTEHAPMRARAMKALVSSRTLGLGQVPE